MGKQVLKKKNRAVMVFGVFDGLHKGHKSFLGQARKYGGKLIAVVARDAAVWGLKRKKPRFGEKERARVLRRSRLADRVVLGDRKQGTYDVIRRYRPDIICLGYDQLTLGSDIKIRIKKGYIPRIHLAQLKKF